MVVAGRHPGPGGQPAEPGCPLPEVSQYLTQWPLFTVLKDKKSLTFSLESQTLTLESYILARFSAFYTEFCRFFLRLCLRNENMHSFVKSYFVLENSISFFFKQP